MGALQIVFLLPARAGLNRTHVGASTRWITMICWFRQWAAAGGTNRVHLSIAACWHGLMPCGMISLDADFTITTCILRCTACSQHDCAPEPACGSQMHAEAPLHGSCYLSSVTHDVLSASGGRHGRFSCRTRACTSPGAYITQPLQV
jgi:hypothetical protein